MREYGVTRKQFAGDSAAAQARVGEARTQLGILKNMMRLGGLQQLSRQITMADGTLIRVASVFGQDFIGIDAPRSGAADGAPLTPLVPAEKFFAYWMAQPAESLAACRLLRVVVHEGDATPPVTIVLSDVQTFYNPSAGAGDIVEVRAVTATMYLGGDIVQTHAGTFTYALPSSGSGPGVVWTFDNAPTVPAYASFLHPAATKFANGVYSNATPAINTLVYDTMPAYLDALDDREALNDEMNTPPESTRYAMVVLSDGTEVTRLYFEKDLAGNKKDYPYYPQWSGGNWVDLYTDEFYGTSTTGGTPVFSEHKTFAVPADVCEPSLFSWWPGDEEDSEFYDVPVITLITTLTVGSEPTPGEDYDFTTEATITVRYGFIESEFTGTYRETGERHYLAGAVDVWEVVTRQWVTFPSDIVDYYTVPVVFRTSAEVTTSVPPSLPAAPIPAATVAHRTLEQVVAGLGLSTGDTDEFTPLRTKWAEGKALARVRERARRLTSSREYMGDLSQLSVVVTDPRTVYLAFPHVDVDVEYEVLEDTPALKRYRKTLTFTRYVDDSVAGTTEIIGSKTSTRYGVTGSYWYETVYTNWYEGSASLTRRIRPLALRNGTIVEGYTDPDNRFNSLGEEFDPPLPRYSDTSIVAADAYFRALRASKPMVPVNYHQYDVPEGYTRGTGEDQPPVIANGDLVVAVISTLAHDDFGELGVFPDERDRTQLTKLKAIPKYVVTLEYDYINDVLNAVRVDPFGTNPDNVLVLTQAVTEIAGDFLAVVLRHAPPVSGPLLALYDDQGVRRDEDDGTLIDPYPLTPAVQNGTTYSIPAIRARIPPYR